MNKQRTSGSVRIIAGEWRSRKLPVAEVSGLRPTSDRVRETLFNWLQPYIAGARCLDLFAGTGALGIEAASRGASHVVMIEKNHSAFNGLKNMVEMLKTDKINLQQVDALIWLETIDHPFDIIFLDPPFDQDLLPLCVDKLLPSKGIKSGTLIYVEEHDQASPVQIPDKLELIKQAKAGQVRYSLLKVS